MGCKAIKGTPTYKLQAEAKERKQKAQADFYIENLHKEHIRSFKDRMDYNRVALAIDNYFNICLYNDIPLTMPGLELALDCEKSEISILLNEDINNSWNIPIETIKLIKKAKKTIENYTAGKLFTNVSTGAIFALKNMGWIDKIETVNTNLTSFSDVMRNAIDTTIVKPMLSEVVTNSNKEESINEVINNVDKSVNKITNIEAVESSTSSIDNIKE